MLHQLNYRKQNIVASSLILTAASAVGQNLSFSCFSSGTQGNCGNFVDTFCPSVSTVRPQDSSSHCYNSDGFGFKCDFTAFYAVGSVDSPPDTTNCELVLGSIIKACPAGGQGSVEGGSFVFTVDPNEGSCGSDSSSSCSGD
ncbi:Y3 protein [Lentinula edodes]|uniref:Y3 protein n=1 Tax=Lentinula edodes TaxID=5353 RepID=A0A1Q3EHP9_LENED|nr:Y3 protein [Lentinula edodes]